MALALKRANDNLTNNSSSSLCRFSYSNANATDAISDAMKLTNFRGISVSACVYKRVAGCCCALFGNVIVSGMFNALFVY